MNHRTITTRERRDQLASPTAFLLQSWLVNVAILVVLVIVLIAFLSIG